MNKTIKTSAKRRLQTIGGQINGLQKMLDEERYCIEIINQSLAIREALASFEGVILENHLTSHVVEQIRGKDSEKAIKELLDLYKFSKRK